MKKGTVNGPMLHRAQGAKKAYELAMAWIKRHNEAEAIERLKKAIREKQAVIDGWYQQKDDAEWERKNEEYKKQAAEIDRE